MAPQFYAKMSQFWPYTPNIPHIRQNPVVTPTPTTHARKKAHFALKTVDFMGNNAFFVSTPGNWI